MGSVGKISVNLEAESAKFSQGTQQASKDVNRLRTDVEHLKKAAAGADVFDQLREGLGRRSALGEASELLKGGGPISGLTGAAEAIKSMAEQAKNLKDQFQSGKLSAGELTEKLIEGVPIVGQFWQAGKAIRELFTNEGADLENANTQAKALDEVLKSQKATFATLKDSARDYADFLEEVNHRINHATLTDNDAKDVYSLRLAADEQADHAAAAQSEAIEREHQEKLKKIREETQPAIDATRKAQKDYQDSNKGDASAQEIQVHMQTLANISAMAQRDRQEAEAQIDATYAAKQVKAAQAAAYEKTAEENKIAREVGAEQKANAERDAKEISDTQAEAQEQTLEAQGRHFEAEKVKLDHALQEKLAAIKKEAEEESKTFGMNDRENQAKVAAGAQDKIAAASAKYQADLDEAAKQEEIRKWDETQKAAEEANKARNEMMEEGRKLTEDSLSPLEKYQEKLNDIRQLYYYDAIDKATFDKATQRANDELASSVKQQTGHAGAETRRFDFNLAKQDQPIDPIQQLVQEQKDATDAAKKANANLDEIVRLQRNRDRDANEVINF
jgi:fused signal recognition particle receptor